MGQLDLLLRGVDSGDPGISGTRQKVQERAVPAAKIDDARSCGR